MASNPYDSPETAGSPSDTNRKWSVVDFVVLGMSLAGTAHFAVSLLYWGLLFYCFSDRFTVQPEWTPFLYSLPSVLLFPLFVLASVRAWRQARDARFLLLTTIILSLAAFSYDAVNHNYQMHVQWKMEDSPPPNIYFNWWWYDERWVQ